MMKILLLLSVLVSSVVCAAQEKVEVTEITPNVLVFATRTGNVVASVGDDGALLVGTPSASSTAQISRILAGKTKSSVRYVVIAPEATKDSEADAGWGRRGAFVAMQEIALGRIGGHVMGKPAPLPPRLRRLGVDRPHVSFSEVLSFDMNGEAIHIVHQTPGYSNGDALVHFHVASVIYFGEVFPGDGYPLIDHAQGGTLDGQIKTLEPWTGKEFKIVPARGSVIDGTRVAAYLEMIKTVRNRIQQMVKEGKTEKQIVASNPTAEFDAQWGHGRASPQAFVREIYAAATAPKTK
jgi:hypothetical protein